MSNYRPEPSGPTLTTPMVLGFFRSRSYRDFNREFNCIVLANDTPGTLEPIRLKLIWNFKCRSRGASSRVAENKTGKRHRVVRRKREVKREHHWGLEEERLRRGNRRVRRGEWTGMSAGFAVQNNEGRKDRGGEEKRELRVREVEWIIVIFKLTNDILHYHSLCAGSV